MFQRSLCVLMGRVISAEISVVSSYFGGGGGMLVNSIRRCLTVSPSTQGLLFGVHALLLLSPGSSEGLCI